MAAKLSRLPEHHAGRLRQLACLGNVRRPPTLALIHGVSEDAIARGALGSRAARASSFAWTARYAFLHDRVQEAAYALIPEGERAAAHLRIGRLLAARTPPAELEEKIFEIVNQLDRGAALIDTPEEREQVAELNLMAGKRAKASTAYASALQLSRRGSRAAGGGELGAALPSSPSSSSSTRPNASF